MVKELEDTLPLFQPTDRTHCFLHVINLVTKSLLKQFDLGKIKGKSTVDLSEEELALLTLAKKLDEEELTTLDENDDDEEPEDDNLEGWIDEFETLMLEEQDKLNMDVLPVRHVLVKVRDEYTPLIDV